MAQDDDSDTTRPSKCRLFTIVILANMASFMMGTSITWCSPFIPKLKYNYTDNPVDEQLDPHKQGAIFSMLSLGAVSSTFFVGILIDGIGRKPIIILSTFLYATAYAVLYTARRFRTIYIGRYIMGIGAGLTMTCIPIYIAELSPKESRGSVGSIFMLFMTLGMLFVYSIGPFTEYKVFQVCGFCAGIVSILACTCIPESPVYLVEKDRIGDAIIVLQKVRGQSADTVKREIPEILDMLNDAKNTRHGAFRKIITNPVCRRAYGILIGLIFFQMFSGSLVMIVNRQTIFIQANSSVEPAISSIIVGCIQCISSLILQLLADRLPRTTLLKASASGMCITQLSVGTYFYFQLRCDISEFRWLPLVLFITFELFYRLGFGPLPFIMLGELFTPDVKAFAGTSLTFTCWGLGFFIGRYYPVLDAFGEQYVFWMFGFLNALSYLFVRFVVIETNRLSLSEIQARLLKP